MKRVRSATTRLRSFPCVFVFWILLLDVRDCADAFTGGKGPIRRRSIPRLPDFGRSYRTHDLPHVRTATIDDTSSGSASASGYRLNKCFRRTHSRREADALIASGRVDVNGNRGSPGQRVEPGDVVCLDGVAVPWEDLNVLLPDNTTNHKPTHSHTHSHSHNDIPKSNHTNQKFVYLKHWKRRGTTCTTDRRVRSNVVDAIDWDGSVSAETYGRIFMVGRLDRDTSGVLLLTSDGRLPNAIGRPGRKQPKVYHVTVDRDLSEQDLCRLRQGVVISTVAQRDRKGAEKVLTAPTLPCRVRRLTDAEVAEGQGRRRRSSSSGSHLVRNNKVEMTLVEGRNRQIRKMMEAIGFTVTKLHRVRVMGIGLDGLRGEGDYAPLTPSEMATVEACLRGEATSGLVEDRESTSSHSRQRQQGRRH